MDMSFEVFVQFPRPARLHCLAEIVGDRGGSWQIGHLYIKDDRTLTFRLADYDERRQIEMSLQTLAGGDIGRAYRRTFEGLHHDND